MFEKKRIKKLELQVDSLNEQIRKIRYRLNNKSKFNIGDKFNDEIVIDINVVYLPYLKLKNFGAQDGFEFEEFVPMYEYTLKNIHNQKIVNRFESEL